MTYEGWFAYGGNEIANNPRAYGIARSASCPAAWFKREGAPHLAEALGDAPYNAQNIVAAPWYDPRIPASERFYGLYSLGLGGTRDSTRAANVTQNAGDGGQIGIMRRGTREVKAKAMLLARGADALEYGRAWLEAALSPGACGQHGTQCGVTDLEYFASPPPAQGSLSDAEYAAELDRLRRYLHDVAAVSGPFTVEEMASGDVFGEVVEWTFVSERPWVYGKTRSIDLPSVPSTVYADIPSNLAPFPSAELTEDTAVLLGTNLCTNPSVETGVSGWQARSGVVSGTSPAAYLTGVQSNDKAGSGTYSFRTRVLGNGSTEVAASRSQISGDVLVSLTAVAADQRVSAHLWVAAQIAAGAAVSTIHFVEARLAWLDAGGAVLSTEVLGVLDPADYATGAAFSATGLKPPAGATQAWLRGFAEVTWRSSATPANNSDIRIYADMATISVP